MFVITGENGKIFTSTNLTTWTQRTSNVTVLIVSVTYGNNQFVTVGQEGTILTSDDGITWTALTTVNSL